jgi:hypothetical protein
MTECRSDDLRKHRAEGAARVRRGSGLNPRCFAAPPGDVAELVNHGRLLRPHEQKQQSKQFENVVH